MTSLSMVRKDRRELQARWRRKGYYADQTLSEALVEGVRRSPDTRNVFYRGDAGQSYSNLELHERALRLAGALRGINVAAGDVVAVQLPTSVEASLIYQAAAHLGAVTLPIISIYGAREVSYIVSQSRAKVLFVPAYWRGRNYPSEYQALRGNTDLETVVAIGGQDVPDCMSWEELSTIKTEGFESGRAGADDVCCLIYTSGTTSDPKGVRHTHNSLLWEWRRPIFADSGLYLSNMPAGHITGYGFMLRPALLGVPQIFMDQWDPDLAARLIEEHRVRAGGGTPLFLMTLLEAAEENGADLSSLQNFSMGGQGITPQQVRLADQMGFRGARVYGSTEHPTVTTYGPRDGFNSRAHTDGKLDTGNEVRIVDDNDADLGVGQEGNILTRGPDMFCGYSDEQLDKEAFVAGGWYRTGDVGKLDGKGCLHITDRKKDIIIRGGENISSLEVEACLLRHPSIRDAAAVAMPDATYGEKVCAFVVPEPNVELTLKDIRSHFKTMGVAVQKSPERLEIVLTLPKNSSGKTLKPLLREKLLQEQ